MINIADALKLRAEENPARIAMHFPIAQSRIGQEFQIRYQDLSFAELDQRSDAIARGLLSYGIDKGQRVVVMVRPSPEFFLSMFALFKMGAVPVLVDPGIDKRALKACLANAAPQAFIGIPLAHLARIALGWAKTTIVKNITVGRRWFWGGETLGQIESQGAVSTASFEPVSLDDLAAILFTSGSTGVPKGVSYQHRHLKAQVELLKSAFEIKPGTINLPTFPPFALFDPALGCTSVIPIMDATRPAKADPRKLISAIRQFHIQNMFGSPALLRTLARYCAERSITLPSLQTVMSAGAPVPPELLKLARRMLVPQARIFTPYGATEALPVAIADDGLLLGEPCAHATPHPGICVGAPLAANTVRIIEITEQVIADWKQANELAPGVIGEITVRGPSVTAEYFNAPDKSALAKIADGDAIVHRMGDVGCLDSKGLLWYCGRKSHRVQTAHGTLFTEPVEAIFNQLPGIARCALVGTGSAPLQTPVIVYEPTPEAKSSMHSDQLIDALQHIAAQHQITRHIQRFMAYPKSLPVDIRHNAKINRELLAQFASAQ
jgi:olefin beta-lactone synthetase